jgi:hypothetical protein
MKSFLTMSSNSLGVPTPDTDKNWVEGKWALVGKDNDAHMWVKVRGKGFVVGGGLS